MSDNENLQLPQASPEVPTQDAPEPSPSPMNQEPPQQPYQQQYQQQYQQPYQQQYQQSYQQQYQQTYQQPQPVIKTKTPGLGSAKKEKWTAVILAFVLGWLGMHKFYLGYKTEGLTMLLVSVISMVTVFLSFVAIAMLIVALIEAVKYATLTEEDFEATYVNAYKGWF